ncbi:MAG: MFS transporter [Melioribacteraceae bacterium]|nr:MFS transporter [Melioribacteraceae bacterium]MCF8263461.1 MFS transporter [Melioribacteraceae bacterium]MCF8430994.1 MFS transporter [Melioribacteraceae bacterium]
MKAENPTKFRTLEVTTISFAHFVHDVYSSFLAPLLPLLIEKLSISYSLAGLLTVFQRIPSLLNPFMGIVADYLAVRYLLIFAPALTATSMSLLGVAPSYSFIVLILIITGISASMFHVPAPVLIRKVSGLKIGKGMGFFMVGGEIARSVAPIYVLAAVSWWGLEGIWKLIPFGWMASLILFLRFRKLKVSDAFTSKEKEIGVTKTFRKFIPLFITVAGISFAGALLRSSLTAFLPTYLNGLGESLWVAGIGLSVLQFTGAIGTFLAGYISDKIGRRNILLIVATLSPILLFVFTISSGLVMFFVLLILGLFVFAIPPVLMAEVNSNKSERPSFINGVYMTLNFSTGGLAVLLVGFLADFFGLKVTYQICSVISLFSFFFIFRIKNK